MGKGKRHFKGGNSSEQKKRRKEAADKWRSVRGDAPRDPDDTAVTGTGTGSRVSGGKSWVLENEKFDAFYRAQHFIDEGDDWASFVKHLQTPLPACFRICPDYPFANELRDQMLSYVGHKIEVETGLEIQPAEQLPWYPNGFGYKLGVDRRAIRKLGVLTDLHKWMIQHTDNGNITRQEAVSMVPPLALDVQPHHRCLDMCAAPGSKTTQLLEIVNRSLACNGQQGLVVANDSDTDRAYMLVHQCKRINSPLLVVTTHKGQYFPFIANDEQSSSQQVDRPLAFFDRVLCDVPCSGDGTLRKNPAIWKRWSTTMGMTLHPLQLMIAKRGLQLLKDDSLMVYSTCSMSPYENEAVVAELLRSSDGTLELVDARQFLPLFKARAGLKRWHVLDDSGVGRRRVGRVADKGAPVKGVSVPELKDDTEDDLVHTVEADDGAEAAGNENVDRDAIAEDSKDGLNIDVKEASTTIKEVSTPEFDVKNDDTEDDLVRMDDDGDDAAENVVDAEDPNDRLNIDVRDASTEVCDSSSSACDPTAPGSDWSHIDDLSLRRCLELGMSLYASFEDVPAHLDRKVRKSLFPPTEEESAWMHLGTMASHRSLHHMFHKLILGAERCMRCVPQDEDTGGFFVATLRKKKKRSAQMSDSSAPGDAMDDPPKIDALASPLELPTPLESTLKPQQDTTLGSKGLVDFHPWDSESFEKMRTFYGLAESVTADCFYVREDAANASATGAAKTIFYIPHSARALMSGDRQSKLKVVTAGVKVFEKKVQRDGSIDYRLLQDGVSHLAPMISQRTSRLCVQDFSNLLGGGLVSFQTLSSAAIQALLSFSTGVVICWYEYDPSDRVVTSAGSSASVDAVVCEPPIQSSHRHHRFYVICWKGYSRALNVMCGKIDLDGMKHQLAALGVLRPKIVAPKDNTGTAKALEQESSKDGCQDSSADSVEHPN